MAKLVSKVYGDALFEAALEENQLDAVWDEVREIASILQENEAFIDIMNHPEMTREKELAMMDEVFGGKVSDVMMGFLQVLVKKGRFGEIESVLEYFDKRAKEDWRCLCDDTGRTFRCTETKDRSALVRNVFV